MPGVMKSELVGYVDPSLRWSDSEVWRITLTLTERDAGAMHRDRLEQLERGIELMLDAFQYPTEPVKVAA